MLARVHEVFRRSCGRFSASQTAWRLLFVFLVLLGGVVALSAQDSAEIHKAVNIFEPQSKPAEIINTLAWFTLLICGGIFVVVSGLLIWVIYKYGRTKAGDDSEPPQIAGSNQIELAWTVIPILIVVVLTMVTARTIGEIQDAKMPPNTLEVTVVGHQWWWELRYPGFVTANELHIPVSTRENSRPTQLHLESADVVHSYWVPSLNGKTDVVPNYRNHMWLEPYKIGTYEGNCAEFCGNQHAGMLIRVVVESEEDFNKWMAHQKEQSKPMDKVPATGTTGASNYQSFSGIVPNSISPASQSPAVLGQQVFMVNSCASCHSIAGTIANGKFGPDLTHLMTRTTFASGMVPNNEKNLLQWMKDPDSLKPMCYMPNMQLTEEQVKQVTAYLMTLD